jgi:hypothetical protein
LFRHPRGEIIENVIDGDTKTPDARLASAFARLDRYVFFVIDVLRLVGRTVEVKQRPIVRTYSSADARLFIA